jgi:hypothetical protein
MIEVNATTILVFVIYTLAICCGALTIGGLLKTNTQDEPDENELDIMRCVSNCGKRKTPNLLLTEKQLKILRRLYPEYVNQCEKEKGVRVDGGFSKSVQDRFKTPAMAKGTYRIKRCETCLEFPCVELDIADDDGLLVNFTKDKLRGMLESGLKTSAKCAKYDNSKENTPTAMTLLGREIVKFKGKGTNVDETV